MNNTTLVGKIINTHGIRGNVKIYPYTDDVNRFKKLDYLLVGEDRVKYEIESVFINKDLAYVKFKEFDNINDVLKFKNLNVYIFDEDRVKLPEGRYFVSDIIGMRVESYDGIYYGDIVSVIDTAVDDVYEVKREDKSYYLPARKEFIKEIDVKNKLLIATPIKGMLD